MKRTFLTGTLFVILISGIVLGQIPKTMSYQGVLKNSDGTLVSDGNYSLIVKLYDSETATTALWTETHSSVSVSDGIFNVILGSVGTLELSFDKQYWLGITVGADSEMSPRVKLTSSPYSLNAKSVKGNTSTSNTFSDTGKVGIGTTNPAAILDIASPDASGIRLVDQNSGSYRASLFNYEQNGGILNLNDASDGSVKAKIRGYSLGGVQAYFTGGNVGIGTTSPGVDLDVVDNIRTKTSGGDNLVWLDQITGGGGWLGTYGPNGNVNVSLTALSGYLNNGYLAVRDASGVLQAGIYVNSDGLGTVFGDELAISGTKSFRIPNPTQAGTEIWYACIEGPEAGAYIRGTAQLTNGTAVVTFPDHFKTVASSQKITVQLTPLSADSKGLAVVTKSLDGLAIQELFNGNGTYDFDYTVMAVRSGYENYSVVRPIPETQAAGVTRVVD